MRYSPILDLSLRHSFYGDGKCPDFAIEASAGTEKALRDHRALLRSRQDGLQILGAFDDAGEPFLAIPEDAPLRFSLRLRNDDFALFTDLSALHEQAAPLFTDADLPPGSGGELALDSEQAWTSESFAVAEPAPEDPFTLGGLPLDGIALGDFEVLSKGAAPSVRGYDPEPRILTLDTLATQPGTAFTVRYPSVPSLPWGVFAEVEVRLGTAPAPRQLHIAFETREAAWAYYCVTDLPASGLPLSVVDAAPSGTSEILEFGAGRDLGEDPDPEDRIAIQLAEKYAELRRLRFVSDEPVALRQAPRKHLELRRDGERLIGPLPNPQIRNHSRIDVSLASGGVETRPSLFQIVKYQNQPFSSFGE